MLSLQDVTAFVITYMQGSYPDLLKERYEVTQDMEDMAEIFEVIGKKRGALASGGKVDYDKVAELFLRDLRTGKIGNITLETVNK